MTSYLGPGLEADPTIVSRVRRMQNEQVTRDRAHNRVLAVRRGEFASIWPDQFSSDYPTAIVANFVDNAARDLSRKIAPLPALACSAGQMKTDADKARAEKLNRIGSNYWLESSLSRQMFYAADQYLTFGFAVGIVEPDFDRKMPMIRLESPQGAYYRLDRWDMKCLEYARVYRQHLDDICAAFPEFESRIRYDKNGWAYEGNDTEVVRWVDDSVIMLYLPERGNLVIAQYEHGMDYCPVFIAPRPGVEAEPRGQFDDVLWVQLAHSVMAALTLEAGHKSVQAPIAMPADVQNLSIGPDAIFVTDNPDKIQRVPLQVPNAAFALAQDLKTEMQEGAGFPETRLGVAPSGGTTGRGVAALEGSYDDQIAQGQTMMGLMIKFLTETCFDMDAKLWRNKRQVVTGTISGRSFELTYTPSKDLAKVPRVAVSYGFATGLSPQGAIVTMLQLQGGGIISRDTFRQNLPFDIDIDQEQRTIDKQRLEEAITEGLAASLQATGQMVATGNVAAASQFFQAAALIIRGRENGEELVDLIEQAFPPPPPPQAQPGAPGVPGAPGGPGGAPGEGLPGVDPNGLSQGVAPGQAGLPPGGRPSVSDLVAGFAQNGAANIADTIHRRLATGS
jgi:hypothetical protein